MIFLLTDLAEIIFFSNPRFDGADQHGPVTVKLGLFTSGVVSQYKDSLSRYADSHVKDNPVTRLSYL